MIDMAQLLVLRDRVVRNNPLTRQESLDVLGYLIAFVKPKENGIVVDQNNGSIAVDGRALVVGMPYMMTKIIAALAECSPRFREREQMVNGIGEVRTIDSHIKRFRRMLPNDSPITVVTRYGGGYALQRMAESMGVHPHRKNAAVLRAVRER